MFGFVSLDSEVILEIQVKLLYGAVASWNAMYGCSILESYAREQKSSDRANPTGY